MRVKEDHRKKVILVGLHPTKRQPERKIGWLSKQLYQDCGNNGVERTNGEYK